MMRAALALLVAIVFAPTISQADWQYTKWGMTPDEVVKVSEGKATPSPYRKNGPTNFGDVELLRGSYQAGPYTFQAGFLFSTPPEKLTGVSLSKGD